MLKRKWILLTIAGVIVSAAALLSLRTPKPQEDCGFVQNVYGQRISWKVHGPIPLVINSSIPLALRPAIYRAAASWENQIGRKIFEISEDSTKASVIPRRDQKNAIYFLANWESDKSSEQGRTSVYWTGDEIQEADIRINASDFSYYDQNSSQMIGSYGNKRTGLKSNDGYSFEALVLHEMGHFLGLKHREGATVMATHLAAFTNRTKLIVGDQQAVACEYN